MPVLEAPPMLRVKSPYPGLRTFEPNEAFLFFGREDHTRQLLARLGERRFLAVVGTSGSGKSSLVRAGLVPALHRGFLDAATSRWKVAIMRPGSAPMANLADALGGKDLLEGLNRSSFGIVETVKASGLGSGENLLLVVDQFEEIFRFQKDRRSPDGAAEGQLFVASLLEAAAEFSPCVYVVLTMRSEFLGDCTQFPGLPEALNQSQYLIPRLTRDQCREAIEKPLAVAGATAAPALVQRLLYELGDDSDQLPVLQHALNRTFERWKDAGADGPVLIKHYPVLIKHYEDAGTLERALNDHAESLLPNDDAGIRWVERVFRCLTTVDRGREVRNPASLERVFAVTGALDAASQKQVRDAIGRFADPKNSLLVLSPPRELKAGTVVDISHESLIRKWGKLKGWVGAERESVHWYQDVVEDAYRYPAKAQTWRDPKLGYALGFIGDGWWNAAWAEWVLNDAKVPFARVRAFLDQGKTEQTDEARRRNRLRNGLIAALVLAVVLALAAVWSYRQTGIARADLDAKTKSEADARKKLEGLQAESDSNRRKQQDLEAQIRDSSGRSAEDIKRLADELARVKDHGTSVDQQTRLAEAKLKDEADARKQLQDKASVGENALAVALKRADDLDRQLKAARADADTNAAAAKRAVELDRDLNEALKGQFSARALPAVAVPVAPAQSLKAGERRLNDKDGLWYRWIPPTSPEGFLMGCSEGEKECIKGEKPIHRVTLSRGFWLGETEATQAAYKKVMRGATPSKLKDDQLPVDLVKWSDAYVYCQAVGMRLPTEAEWEYAARAGSSGATYANLDKIAWYGGNSGGTPHPVGMKDANAWGLQDMLGNVQEWVADWAGPYTSATLANPKGPETGRTRVLRGGTWDSSPGSVRVSYRVTGGPEVRNVGVGFRCGGEFL